MTDIVPHEHPRWLREHADMIVSEKWYGYGALADQMRSAADQMDSDAAEIERLKVEVKQLRYELARQVTAHIERMPDGLAEEQTP